MSIAAAFQFVRHIRARELLEDCQIVLPGSLGGTGLHTQSHMAISPAKSFSYDVVSSDTNTCRQPNKDDHQDMQEH